MSVIRISANRSVIQVQRGAVGTVSGLSALTVGQLAPFTVAQLASI
ncbi:MAG TPA: hypothetical protein VNG35_17105 [Gemmatimonadales bacterium]|nr:hypothetical protein [Gemmatimonadales bacterium]